MSVLIRRRSSVLGGILTLVLCFTSVACSPRDSGTAATNAAGGGGRGGGRGRGRGGNAGAQPVVVAKVSQRDVPVEIGAVGNVEASTMIAVRSQVTGVLEEVGFHEGDFVKKGAVLFTIDRRPLESTLEQAEANLVRDEALVSQAEAQLARDASNAEYQSLSADRQSQLVTRGIVAKDAGDQARAQADATALAVKADRAAVDSAKAQLTVQQAAVNAAKVQLGYTVIRSPIDGRTGDLTVKGGNLVTGNNTQLMTIAQLEPVFVTFSVPSLHLAAIKRAAAGGVPLMVIADPQDGDARTITGRLTFWDNIVDQTTDSIKLKATFDNKDHRLWPGQFARVTLQLSMLTGATVVPQEAIQAGQDGSFVFVVNNQRAEQRPVKTGSRIGDDIVVQQGLVPGETVVTEGQLRLEQGTQVQLADANGNPQGGRGGTGGRGGQNGRGRRNGGNANGGTGGSSAGNDNAAGGRASS
jgi:multidrug efflux system membrane fusion protein